MIHILSSGLPKRRLQVRYGYSHMLAGLAAAGARAGPHMLRVLVLGLVALIFIFVGLMELTGSYEAGAPVLGSVLLIGLGAAQYAEK